LPAFTREIGPILKKRFEELRKFGGTLGQEVVELLWFSLVILILPEGQR
jgi:hypothetical protein